MPVALLLERKNQVTRSVMSVLDTAALGGIGTGPQTPEPPSFTFFEQLRDRVLVALVFGCDFRVARTDDLLVDRSGERRSRSFSSSPPAAALSSAACAVPVTARRG